jgi:hypothetical protein
MQYDIHDINMYITPFMHNFSEFKDIYTKRKKEFEKLNMIDLNDYFVEFFSWSPIPFDCLVLINTILKKLNIRTIYDPCAGTGYHAFLFSKILNYNIIATDIQPESYNNPWFNVVEQNCLTKNKMDENKMDENTILILSWMEYNKLSESLIKNLSPKYIMLIGIYHRCDESKEFYEKLITEHEFIEELDLIPYYNKEKIEKVTIIKMLK